MRGVLVEDCTNSALRPTLSGVVFCSLLISSAGELCVGSFGVFVPALAIKTSETQDLRVGVSVCGSASGSSW